MAKGSGGTRAGGTNTRGVVEAPRPSQEELEAQEFERAVNSFASLSPVRSSFERDARANIGEVREASAFTANRKAKAIRDGAMEGLGQMYDTYRIPRLTQVAFNGENRYSDEGAATSLDGKYMRFNTGIRSRNEAKEFAVHELTHVMVGPKFQNLSTSEAQFLRSIYNTAKSAIPEARGRNAGYQNYWRTDAHEFVSVAFQKALTGQSLNGYERAAFMIVHNKFKK